jgi:Ala-tRNA(Pro) deacylase
MTVAEVTEALERAGAQYELLRHEHTETALDEAKAVGVSPEEVAKTLIVMTPRGYIRAVVPATERMDFGKFRRLVGAGKHKVQLASEDELRTEYPEFELGAVPPFGGLHVDPVVVDESLTSRDSVIVEAGSHEDSVRVRVDDLVRMTHAEVADICMH